MNLRSGCEPGGETGVWDSGIRAIAVLEELQRRHSEIGHGQMKAEQLEIARLQREVIKLKAGRADAGQAPPRHGRF